MSELLFYIPSYVNAAERFITNSGLFSADYKTQWIDKKIEHDSLRRQIGSRNNQPQVIDREGKVEFLFKTKPHTKIPPMVYKQGLKPLEDLLIDRAIELKNKNKFIQLFWSGGVDSTAALFALREVCPDQVMVQTTPDAVKESPGIYKKFVKDLSHNIHTEDNLLGIADSHKYIVSTACCADQLYNTNGRGSLTVSSTDPLEYWYRRNRFGRAHRTFRWFLNTSADYVVVDNIQPFYDCEYIEQHFINMILDGRLTFTDKSDEGYKQHKPDLRKFLMKYDYEFGANKLGRQDIRHSDANLRKSIEYNNNKNSTVEKDSNIKGGDWRIMAITSKGEVLLRENHNFKKMLASCTPDEYMEYGLKTFIPYLSMDHEIN
jgi:hypothetical protein